MSVDLQLRKIATSSVWNGRVLLDVLDEYHSQLAARDEIIADLEQENLMLALQLAEARKDQP